MSDISNEVYEKALNNRDNVLIMHAASSRFNQQLTPDEIHSCELMALWHALRLWRPDKGKKFTSFLYNKVFYECLRTVVVNRKNYMIQSEFVDKAVSPQPTLYEILDGVPDDISELLEKRYIYGMTLREIGEEYGYCYETIRKRLKKAQKYVKMVYNTIGTRNLNVG